LSPMCFIPVLIMFIDCLMKTWWWWSYSYW